MEYIANAAQPTDAHMGFGFAIFRAMVGNGERQIAPAEADFAGIGGESAGVEGGGNRRKRAALQPGGRFSVGIEGSFEVHRSDAVIGVELNVVLAAPDYFYRLSRFFG